MSKIVAVSLFVLAAIFAPFAAGREWRDSTGKFSIEAEFVRLSGNDVILRKSDGGEIQVAISRLSEADRKHLASIKDSKPNIPALNTHDSKPTTPDTSTVLTHVDNDNVGPAVTVEDVLAKKITVDFADAPLANVCETLSKQSGYDFRFDHAALKDAGIDPSSTNMTIHEVDKPLMNCLEDIHRQGNLEWLPQYEAIFITTGEKASATIETHVYRLAKSTLDSRQFINNLTKEMAPYTWSNTGGPGTVVPFGARTLVISQTYRIHRMMQEHYGDQLSLIRSLRNTEGLHDKIIGLLRATGQNRS